MAMAAAVTMWLLIVLLPGVALLRLLPAGYPVGWSLAVAAPVGFAFLFLVGLLAQPAGLPLLKTCAGAAAGLSVVWLAVEAVRLRARGIGRSLAAWRASGRDRRARADVFLVVAAIAIGLALWSAVHDHLTVPAGWDAMHHGYYVRQIVRYDTLKTSIVLSSDPTQADGTSSFYPLAPHLAAALLYVASGVQIPTLLFAMTTAFGGVVLPSGMYVLARRLTGGQPYVAGLAALASVLPATFYTMDEFGRITTVVGLALIPAVGALLLSLRGRRVTGRVVACALGLVGLFEAHTSELPIAVGLVLVVLAVDALGSRQWRAFGRHVGFAVGAGVLALGLLALLDPGARHMLGQRSAFFAIFTRMSPGNAIDYFTVGPSILPSVASRADHVWMTLALAGCAATLHPRWRAGRASALAYLGFVTFGIVWSAGYLGPLHVLADPWYQSAARVRWELCVLGAIPVAFALAAGGTVVVHALRRLRPRRPYAERPRAAVSTVAVLGLLAAAVWFMHPPALSISRWARANESPVGTDSLAAFRYLDRHTRGRARVLDDLDLHGDLWMYDTYGVLTTFGSPPLIGLAPDSWKRRLYLRAEVSHMRSNGCVSALLRAYDVRYVYYSDQRFYDNYPRFATRTLSNRKNFREVFSRGPAQVYEVLVPRTVRPCRDDTVDRYPWSTVANAR